MSDPGMGSRGGRDSGLHPEAREMFATILERMDNLKEAFKEHTKEDDERFKDHESRLRAAEGVIGRAVGYAAGIAGMVGFAGSWLGKKIGLS